MKIEIDKCYNMDCRLGMQSMQKQRLKADWCIADPPYGIQTDKLMSKRNCERYGKSLADRRVYNTIGWDNKRIDKEFFNLMFQLSNNQIIFGGNYYADMLPPTKSWIVWNKRMFTNTERNDFADCELAWCSKGVARAFNYVYNGMLQGDMKNKDYRFHPTQKPTQLWVQLLNYYTKEGDLILDPFAGSQSLRVACHKLQRHYIGFELETDYYNKGVEWFNSEAAQISIFDM